MTDIRPKWMRWGLGFIIGILAFLLSIFACIALTISIADAIIPGEGVSILPGIVLLIISLMIAIYATIRTIKYQDTYMANKSRTTNLIVMILLYLVFVVFLPVPFTHIVF